MSDKREILAQMTFGKRIAEEEGTNSRRTSFETDQWRNILTREIDVVYGAKGSGKSAIYSLLQKRKPELNERGIVIIAGENVRGTPVFKDLIADPPASEEQFRNLWKVYLLSLIGSTIARVDMQGPHARRVVEALEGAKLEALQKALRAELLDLHTAGAEQETGSPYLLAFVDQIRRTVDRKNHALQLATKLYGIEKAEQWKLKVEVAAPVE